MNVDEAIKKISDMGYKSVEEAKREFTVLSEEHKKFQPNVSEEARNAFILNILVGRANSGNERTFKGYFIGFDAEFDKNKKHRDRAAESGVVNEKGELVFVDMPKTQSSFEGQPIPSPMESMNRVCYFIGTVVSKDGQEDWKKGQLWLQKPGIVPPVNVLTEFRASGNFTGESPMINSTDKTNFTVLSEDKVDFQDLCKILLQNNMCNIEELNSFDQPKNYPLLVFKAQIVRITLTRAGKSNAVEVRKIAQNIDDLFSAEIPENFTLWCDKQLPLDLAEGDITWCIVNKYARKDGTNSFKGFGFFAEQTSFPKNKPLPLTEENTKVKEQFGD